LFFLTALSTPASYFTNYYLFGNLADMLTMLYLWWMLVKAVLEKRDHARIILFGFTLFMLAVFNDILYDMRMIHTGYYLEWGLDFFILGLGLVLALNFSKSFVLTEKLSFQLTELNQSLEEKVKSRTKKMEESNRNLRETNEQLKNKNEQIKEYEQSRRHLLTNISHELRTPITLIQGYLEALIYNVIQTPEKRHEHLVQIHSKTIQLNQLIEDLFELSRIEVKQASFKIEFVELLPWIEDIFSRFSKDVEQANIHFQKELASPVHSWWLKIDAARMDQVLSNLVFNAIKHTPVHGVIRIIVDLLPIEDRNEEKVNGATATVPFQLRVRVGDNGHGIPESDLSHIFERFYQAKNTGSKQGTGLGLAISKAIIEYHGGTIGVESKEGKGSTFFFTLPLYQRIGDNESYRFTMSFFRHFSLNR
ncbi:MAG TPA: ATP-binding protein, partial [Bacillales bacterium]|nr:ATP-binding protein [Bacillales bacterium]